MAAITKNIKFCKKATHRITLSIFLYQLYLGIFSELASEIYPAEDAKNYVAASW
jgi:hypothetical protein